MELSHTDIAPSPLPAQHHGPKARPASPQLPAFQSLEHVDCRQAGSTASSKPLPF